MSFTAGEDGATLTKAPTGHQPGICCVLQGLLSKQGHKRDKNNLFCFRADGIKLELLEVVLHGWMLPEVKSDLTEEQAKNLNFHHQNKTFKHFVLSFISISLKIIKTMSFPEPKYLFHYQIWCVRLRGKPALPACVSEVLCFVYSNGVSKCWLKSISINNKRRWVLRMGLNNYPGIFAPHA